MKKIMKATDYEKKGKLKKASVGIIGAGRIGRIHAENLTFRIPQANLIAIAERKKQMKAAVDLAQKLNVFKTTDDYHEILQDQEIGAIVICSSTDTHVQIIKEAAQAGKHIFCEKPIDHNLTRIDQALKAVEKAGVKLQIGFNRRFDPDFARIQQRILGGEVGDLRKIKIISRDPSPPDIGYIKISGGIFMDMTIHDFDMAAFLAGAEAEEIFALGGIMVDPKIGRIGDIDTADIMIRFKNGVIGTIDNCRQSAIKYDQRVEAFGSGGILFNENRRIDNTVLANAQGEHASEILDFFLERYKESFVREMQAFVDAVLNDTETPVTGKDGRSSVVMAMAAQKSLKEKRTVKLSEIK